MLENVDPTSVSAALDRIDPRRVLVNVISKSGGTAETMAQYLIVRSWLERALGAAASRHFVFTTDPERGACGSWPNAITSPPWTCRPGRWPVQCPVAGRPAAGSPGGYRCRGIAEGCSRRSRAGRIRGAAQSSALYAATPCEADTQEDARVHVLMPYTDRLRELAEWFRQLWAESLGKRSSRRARPYMWGPPRSLAVGATDQHSQVQLFMEGPYDKVITFVTVDDLGVDLEIPRPDAGAGNLPPDLAYLPGHTLGELLHAEYEAVSQPWRRWAE